MKTTFHPIKIIIYIQDENSDKTHVNAAATGIGGGASQSTRISTFEAKTAVSVLQISVTLYYAIDSEEAMV